MDTSIFLARLIGPIFVVIGLGLLVSQKAYRDATKEVLKSRALLYLFGLVALTAGLAIVLTHNEWDWDWPIIITLIGWIAMVRGAVRIVVPQQVGDLASKIMARNPQVLILSGVIVLVLGAVLAFMGYRDANP